MSSKVGGSLLTSGEADEDKDITLDDFLKRVKDGLFGVLFVTNKNSDHNLTWHFLEVCIDHLQDLAFPLCFLLAPWQSEITWLQIILRWISPEKMIQNNPVVFNILLSSLGFVLLNALWVGYSFSQNRFRFIWTLKLLRITLGLFASVLFIPFLGFFTQAVIECDGSHDMGSCWNSANLLRSVATVFVITLFIILAFCVKATFFEPDAKAKDIASRPHSRLEILHLAVRTLLTVLTVIFEVYGNDKTDPNKRVTAIWAFTVVCVLTSSGLAFGFIWYIPYYNFRYAIFRAALMLHFFWSCMCLLFTVIRPNSDIGIIFIALTPIAFLLAGFLTEIRRRSIEKTVVATISDPFTLELYIRFKLIDAGLLYRETSMGMVQGDIEAGRGGIMSGINFGAQKQMSGSTEREIKLMDELVEAYVIAAKNMPKSCMLQLFAGAFYLIHLNNRAQCLATYTKAELLHPRIDEAFMIFRRQRLLNEKFSGGDVIDFIAFEQNMQQARKYESKATLAVIHFWAELLKKQPSFRRLQGHGAAIAAAVSSAQTHYLALIKLSPGAPHVYQLYGHFLINVMNDTKQGQDLLDHAEELEEEHNEMMDDGGDTEAGLDMDKANLDLLSEDNAVITISGEYHNLGHIINVNAMAIKVFGYRRQELIQHNINKLLPSPFSEAHDMFLQRYLETGLAKVIDRARQVLGLGKQGYLFPLTLCVKHMVDAKGMQSFLGIIKPQPESESSGFLIMNAKFEILHFTRNIGDLFGTKPFESSYDDSETRLTITHWIPAITSETASQFLSKTGMKLQHVSHGINYDVTIHGDNVQVTGASCYICRIRFKPEKLDSTIREDAMVDDPIPGGCPFMDDQLRRSSIGRAPRISVANADRHIGEEFDSNGSVDLPMNFSAHNSKENLATNPFGTPNMTAPRRQFSVNGSEPGRTSALSNVRRTAVMSDVASLTSMQRTRNASGRDLGSQSTKGRRILRA
ncbi:hypothetical protein BC829DRAFT_181720 [Chytridium lagenaria]|nr:hypothetical protein BC829DRAFT_181720 [Chytridium lagenaria]